jgi:hypothetical protein
VNSHSDMLMSVLIHAGGVRETRLLETGDWETGVLAGRRERRRAEGKNLWSATAGREHERSETGLTRLKMSKLYSKDIDILHVCKAISARHPCPTGLYHAEIAKNLRSNNRSFDHFNDRKHVQSFAFIRGHCLSN